MPKKPAPDPQSCGSCRCFAGKPKDDTGPCKRFPPIPVVVADQLTAAFPVVSRGDICGEYARRLQS